MRKHLLSVVAVALYMAPAVAEATAAAEPSVASRYHAAVESAVAKGHPRLFADAAAFERLKAEAGKPGLRQVAAAHVRESAERLLGKKPLERRMTGRRLLSVSRRALYRISTLAMAYRLTDDRRFLDRAVAEMKAVCAFSDWNPSHFLDTGEMSLAVAIGYDWLYADLPDDVRAEVRAGLARNGLAAGAAGGWWTKARNNWGQVCRAGMIAASLSLADDPQLLDACAKMLGESVEALPLSMAAMAPDGCYPEGTGYWHYGVSFNVFAIAMLESACGTDFGLSGQPGFMETAEYPNAVTGPTGMTVAYSDCGSSRGAMPPLWWFAKKLHRPDLVTEREVAAWRAAPSGEGWLPPVELFWMDDRAGEAAPRAKAPLVWAPRGVVPLAVLRSGWGKGDAFAGIKGGSPRTNHGHMDGGNFVLDMGGVRWAWELPHEDYNRIEQMKDVSLWNMAQNSGRWSLLRLNTFGHNVPSIDGEQQSVDGFAKVLKAVEDPLPSAELDLTSLYPAAKKAVRTCTLGKGGRTFLVQDVFEGLKPGATVRWQFILKAKSEVEESGGRSVLKLAEKGRSLVVLRQGTDASSWQVEPAEGPQPLNSPNPGFSRAFFTLTADAKGRATAEVMFALASADAPAKVIFDTDMFTDFDDVGALACLHALADAGECEILATVSSTRGNASVGAVEVINRYYGRPDIPTGAPKGIGVMGVRPGATAKVDPACPLDGPGGKDGMHYKYRKLLADYPDWFRHADADDAPDANEVYRRVLAAQPDGSVVVCSVGFLTNLRRLLETKPDGISPLGGRELVAKKVKLWVAMACRHPSGREFNSMCDAESSRIALENWPTPVVFTDWNYGHDCFAGRAVAEMEGARNPVKDIFADNLPPRGEVERDPAAFLKRGFGVGGRSAWDETAVLIAVRGFEPYFNVERGTYRMVGGDGSDEWIADAENGRHLRVTEKLSKAEVGRVIDGLMTRKPAGGRAAPHRIDAKPGESLAALRDRVRALPEDARRPGVEVVLPPGDYVLADTLRLDAKDGGVSAEAPVVWRGAKGARIIGGVRVEASRFRPVEDQEVLKKLPEEARGKVVVADLSADIPGGLKDFPDQFSGDYPTPIVFANHAFATPARWPNEGYAKFSQRIDGGSFDPARRGFYYRGAFKFDYPRAARWDFASGVWLNGYWTHDWDNASVRAESWGDEGGTNGVMRLAGGVPYGVMGGTWGPKERRFYAFNLIEELDAPGEWWIDRRRKLLYLVPPKGALSDADEIVVSFARRPFVKGDGGLSHIAFEDIAFEYSAGDGLRLDGSDVHVRNCRVSCCGGSGVVVYGNGNSVSGCEIAQTGQSGVEVKGGDRKRLASAGTSVDGNDIHGFGVVKRTYAPGIAVGGCGIAVRRNKIYDAPHSAVIYGGNEHLFESNDVHHVLLETGDAGAFYTGRDWTTQGTVLRYNFVHDLGAGTSYGSGTGDTAVSGENTMGFYFDDCDCGDAVYGNVFHNVARGIMIGGGREHPVAGNVFSRCNIGLSIDCRGMTWKNWNTSGGSWNLEEKAQQFDYTNGVWAARYPLLAKIMQDHPREPLYNPVTGNVFVACREVLRLDKVAPLERMAPISGNVVVVPPGGAAPKVDPRVADGFRTVEGPADLESARRMATAR